MYMRAWACVYAARGRGAYGLGLNGRVYVAPAVDFLLVGRRRGPVLLWRAPDASSCSCFVCAPVQVLRLGEDFWEEASRAASQWLDCGYFGVRNVAAGLAGMVFWVTAIF